MTHRSGAGAFRKVHLTGAGLTTPTTGPHGRTAFPTASLPNFEYKPPPRARSNTPCDFCYKLTHLANGSGEVESTFYVGAGAGSFTSALSDEDRRATDWNSS